MTSAAWDGGLGAHLPIRLFFSRQGTKKSDDAGKWDRRSPGHQGVTTAGVVTFAVGDFNEWILMTASALSVRGREVPCTNQCFDRS